MSCKLLCKCQCGKGREKGRVGLQGRPARMACTEVDPTHGFSNLAFSSSPSSAKLQNCTKAQGKISFTPWVRPSNWASYLWVSLEVDFCLQTTLPNTKFTMRNLTLFVYNALLGQMYLSAGLLEGSSPPLPSSSSSSDLVTAS